MPEALGLMVGVAAENEADLIRELVQLAAGPPPDAIELAALVGNQVIEKFDMLLGDELLTLAYARDRLDVVGLPELAATLLESLRNGCKPG